jgi:hypothetical protein
MPIARILTMAATSPRGLDAARLILNSTLTYLDGPEPTATRRSLRDMVDDMHAEVGEVAAEWRAAMFDGTIDAAEAKALVRSVHDVEIACAKIRHEAAKLTAGEGA